VYTAAWDLFLIEKLRNELLLPSTDVLEKLLNKRGRIYGRDLFH
jgi:hypothetical protein